MEPGTALMLLGGAIGSKDLIVKLLGPTAEYLGNGIQSYTQKAAENLGHIFQNAERKLGDNIEKPGQVPPKVLKGILEEGSFCEDKVAAEYFGGVLASSRGEINRDDRGAVINALIGRLSTYQIRSHYIFYSLFKKLCHGKEVNLGLVQECQKFNIYVPVSVYVSAMDFKSEENINTILQHIMHGLSHEDLIDHNWASGPTDILKTYVKDIKERGLVFRPSALGMALFLWAHGVGDVPLDGFLNENNTFQPIDGINIIDGSTCTIK